MIDLRNVRYPVLLGLAAVLAAAGFLVFSYLTLDVGFPLDDAWIHQVYARNLALRGEWSFLPAEPSAGSTAPLWSILLAPGYMAGLSPYLLAFVWGIIGLGGIAMLGEAIIRRRTGTGQFAFPWAGLLLVFEWHLVWASVSGMETALFAFFILMFFWVLGRRRINWLLLGILAGITIWIRPDGLTLVFPATFSLMFFKLVWRKRLKKFFMLILGVGLLLVPYIIFVHSFSGAWLPNTFFAKQAEYAALQQTPLINRWLSLAALPLVGAGVLLLPGAVYSAVDAVRKKSCAEVSAWLWWLGFILIYALRLPVTYQHGRYLIPAMPVYFVLGYSGLQGIIGYISEKFQKGKFLLNIFSRVWILSVFTVGAVFYLFGARAYARDVAVIQTEMVGMARWIETHTSADALIAAHDIGALGYFGDRKILDLAGLISPDVIQFIRDEDRLADYLDTKHADYLVTFPSWYPDLVSRSVFIHRMDGQISRETGGENMQIYRWGN